MKCLNLLYITVFFFLLNPGAKAQDSIQVTGYVIDQFNNPVFEAFIKITAPPNTKPLHYTFLGDNNRFSIQIPAMADHHYFLTIGKAGYRDTLIELGNTNLASLLITLSPVGLTLGEVIIETPSIYEKGDTTFHKVSAFTSGTEQNLGELIKKIPGFSITGDGTLLFKNKIVEKILVQGEDLFSEKQSLLLLNFPPDVIENIQGLENQIDNPLLKGLETGNKTWVNLSLKKEKIKALGYVDAGYNSNNKYLISPLLFSIHKKTKLAIIGNYNNQGSGSSILQHYELKTPLTRWNERWLSPLPYYEQVGELQSEHFLQNNIRDTRMKLNSSIGKKIKTQTEMTWLTDQWSLNKNTEQFIEADSTIQFKLENRQSVIKPEKLSLQQKLDWSLNKKSELKLSFLAFGDRTNVDGNLTQTLETIPDSLTTGFQLRNISYSLNTKYTNRINNRSAIVLEMKLERIRTRQNEHYINNQLHEMINGLPFFYNALLLSRFIRSETASSKLTFLTKPGKRRISPYINFENRKVVLENEYSFGNKLKQVPDSAASAFPDFFKMSYIKVESGIGYGGGKNLIWNLNGRVGIYQPQTSVNTYNKNISFIGGINGNFKLNRNRFKHDLTLSLSRAPLHLQELYPLIFAKTPTQYIQFSSTNNTYSNLGVTYYLSKTFRNGHMINFMLNHGIRFGNFVYEGSLNRIFQQTRYDFRQRPISSQSFLFSYYLPLIARSYVEIDFNFNRMGSLVKSGEDILRANYNQYIWEIKAEKRWKKHELKFSGKYFTVNSVSSRKSNYKSQTAGIHQFTGASGYVVKIGKNWSAENQLQYFKTHSLGNETSDLLFAHSAIHYFKKNTKWRLTAFLNNLTNVKSYQAIWSSFPITGNTTIPLTKRNIAVKFRYNL